MRVSAITRAVSNHVYSVTEEMLVCLKQNELSPCLSSSSAPSSASYHPHDRFHTARPKSQNCHYYKLLIKRFWTNAFVICMVVSRQLKTSLSNELQAAFKFLHLGGSGIWFCSTTKSARQDRKRKHQHQRDGGVQEEPKQRS